MNEILKDDVAEAARCADIRARMPDGGLFAGHDWRSSPSPLEVPAPVLETIRRLGPALQRFVEACNRLYLESAAGDAPPWIARWLDAGKSADLVAFARERLLRNELPRVIRPDLILTDTGLCLCELDSVPGGIGAAAWLQEVYVDLGFKVVGGAQGMREGWRRIFPQGDVVISSEAATYRPEMEWLNAGSDTVEIASAETYRSKGRPIYRFFEAFDLPNLPNAAEWRAAVLNRVPMTPPLKPHLEEKLWLALFWLPVLQSRWRELLGEKHQALLRGVIPYGWVVNPEPIPPHAAIPRLDIHSWEEAKGFSQKRRRLVLKVSGFSERAWGSRGVVFGHDVPGDEWAAALDGALTGFATQPHLLQEFHQGAHLSARYLAESGGMDTMAARARLCPYYFIAPNQAPHLGGVLATLCPADKKAVHGMRDAIMTVVGDG
ncbi:MAG TPA: hypothetical protein PLU30_17750 [Verrucomicrobiae bacterium]|nr:hypothetical protein [Verrucomicrobiae bacterium]